MSYIYTTEFIEEIARQVDDINNGRKGDYFYAFNPSCSEGSDSYERNIRLISTIYDVLNEFNINIKTRGYTYLKDAICIITDKKNMDVCLLKEVYPYIADKHKVKGAAGVEHNIRNSINAAYRKSSEKGDRKVTLMDVFDKRPTNKSFILAATQEVSDRLGIDLCV